MNPRFASPRAPDEPNESYLASISDLMAALMFVFIIVVTVFALELARANARLTADEESRAQLLREIAERVQAASGVRVIVDEEHGIIRLTQNAVHFPLGGTHPIARHEPHVGAIAQVLADLLPCYVASASGPRNAATHASSVPSWCPLASTGACKRGGRAHARLLEAVLIEGHTDAIAVKPGNRFLDNVELSAMRAAEVLRMFEVCRPELAFLRNSNGQAIFSTAGYGSRRPIAADPADPANRRIDLRFLLEPPRPSHQIPARLARPFGD